MKLNRFGVIKKDRIILWLELREKKKTIKYEMGFKKRKKNSETTAGLFIIYITYIMFYFILFSTQRKKNYTQFYAMIFKII